MSGPERQRLYQRGRQDLTDRLLQLGYPVDEAEHRLAAWEGDPDAPNRLSEGYWRLAGDWIQAERARNPDPRAQPEPAPPAPPMGVEPERNFAGRKAEAMARLEAHGIPTTWVDAWVEWWEAADATNSRHHPGFWEQAYQHIAREWDGGRTVPPTMIEIDDPDRPR